MKVEVVTGALPCVLGEGPHWDATEGVLYYVDIPQGRVLRYDPQNNNTSYVNVSVIFRLGKSLHIVLKSHFENVFGAKIQIFDFLTIAEYC